MVLLGARHPFIAGAPLAVGAWTRASGQLMIATERPALP